MKRLAACFLVLCATSSAQQPEAITYRFDEVKRTVTVTNAKAMRRVDKGAAAASGDAVETGWFSYALISADHYRAKFEVYSSTKVVLAEGTPGVILSLERGRIHAIFDKITGNEPRIVKTPGALLAVRGTQYSVNVENSGQTTLDVFEGTVEVQSPLRREPFMVHAGQESVFSHREPPSSRDMPKGRQPDGRTRGDEGQRQPQDGNHRGPGPGDHGGPQPMPMPPQGGGGRPPRP